MKWKAVKTLKGGQFKRLTGVERDTFDKMVSEIKKGGTPSRHKVPGIKKGPKPKLIAADELLIMLMYYREYRTFYHIGLEFGISEAQCWRIVTKIEKILLECKLFHLPGKKKLLEDNLQWEVVLVDASEHSIERPQKNREDIIREKKKKHTLKSQLVVDKTTGQIICSQIGKGRRHDFHLYKHSKVHVHPDIEMTTDTGYLGLQKIHPKTKQPKKRSKKNPLTKQDKKENRSISSERVVAEHIIRRIKIFRIMGERYRNRRKRFGLRLNLIAGLYNFEL